MDAPSVCSHFHFAPCDCDERGEREKQEGIRLAVFSFLRQQVIN